MILAHLFLLLNAPLINLHMIHALCILHFTLDALGIIGIIV